MDGLPNLCHQWLQKQKKNSKRILFCRVVPGRQIEDRSISGTTQDFCPHSALKRCNKAFSQMDLFTVQLLFCRKYIKKNCGIFVNSSLSFYTFEDGCILICQSKCVIPRSFALVENNCLQANYYLAQKGVLSILHSTQRSIQSHL